MTKKTTTFLIISFLSSFVLITSCSKNTVNDSISLEGNLEISDFVWKGLNQFYYWQSSVSNLSDSKANDANSYATFIQQNPNPDAFFESLKSPEDRFSWIEEDYEVLENSLQGISASNGVEFSLSLLTENGNSVIGIVRYILPNSDASTKNIKRGDIFYAVNGVEITVDNYRNLLYGDTFQYTLNMATIEDGAPVSNGVSVPLTKVPNFYKEPILIDKVIDINATKVGYIMYNQFVGSDENNNALNDAFGRFKAEGISDLVVDLRYNRGGSVANCTYLASMITGQFKDEVFASQVWNEKLMDYWNESDPGGLVDNFTERMSNGASINSLNLSRVYILTTSSSASASELLINGLDSHIDVIQIGDTTVGKNVGSITLYDYIDNDGTKNPNHKYAMQPIVLKIANSDGFADFTNGLVPDIEQNEDLLNMGTLGDENEPYLQTALNAILGISKRGTPAKGLTKNLMIKDPEMVRQQNMHIELENAADFLIHFK